MKNFLSNKAYDILSWIALVALDAVGECYKVLAKIWSLPYGNEVFETCVALSILLGILIGVSKATYNKNKAETVDSPIEWNLSFGGETDETNEDEEDEEEE